MRFVLRTQPEQRAPRDAILLAAFDAMPGHDRASTVETYAVAHGSPRRERIDLDPAVSALVWFSISVLAADTISARSESADGWTRTIDLSLPLPRARWTDEVLQQAEAMLAFLTG